MSKRSEKIINRLKKSYPVLLLGLILFILSSVVTIYQGAGVIGDFYKSSLGYKHKLYEDFGKLSPGVSIDYFKEVLGSSVFVNVNEGVEHEKEVFQLQREYVFINKYSYVQAITNKNDTVIAYSITTKKEGFVPKFIFWNGTEDESVVLGKSTFSELKEEPENIFGYCGVHNGGYQEEYYFGNPGNYQTYIFSMNDSGLGNEQFPFFLLDKDSNATLNIFDEEVKKYREKTFINTYTETAPFVTASDVGFKFGPDLNQVRTFQVE